MRAAFVIAGLLVGAGRAGAEPCPVAKTTSPDGKRTATLASVGGAAQLSLDGKTAVLTSFPVCAATAGFRWSSDSQRVLVALDSGHGLRIALFDGTLVANAFARVDAAASPELRHVAWVHWSEDWPKAAKRQTLHVDERTVRTGGTLWNLAWRSDTELAFCDGGDAYVATIGRTITVKANGTCAG